MIVFEYLFSSGKFVSWLILCISSAESYNTNARSYILIKSRIRHFVQKIFFFASVLLSSSPHLFLYFFLMNVYPDVQCKSKSVS